jgi:hypothetical protein
MALISFDFCDSIVLSENDKRFSGKNRSTGSVPDLQLGWDTARNWVMLFVVFLCL